MTDEVGGEIDPIVEGLVRDVVGSWSRVPCGEDGRADGGDGGSRCAGEGCRAPVEVMVEDWLPAVPEPLGGGPNGLARCPEDGVGGAGVGLQNVIGVANPGRRCPWFVDVGTKGVDEGFVGPSSGWAGEESRYSVGAGVVSHVPVEVEPSNGLGGGDGSGVSGRVNGVNPCGEVVAWRARGVFSGDGAELAADGGVFVRGGLPPSVPPSGELGLEVGVSSGG